MVLIEWTLTVCALYSTAVPPLWRGCVLGLQQMPQITSSAELYINRVSHYLSICLSIYHLSIYHLSINHLSFIYVSISSMKSRTFTFSLKGNTLWLLFVISELLASLLLCFGAIIK
jgi:hypothetical protein